MEIIKNGYDRATTILGEETMTWREMEVPIAVREDLIFNKANKTLGNVTYFNSLFKIRDSIFHKLVPLY